MTATIVNWLMEQIALDEAFAREGSANMMIPSHRARQVPDGVHWTWVEGEDWEPVEADVTNPDFYADGLCSVEKFPTGPVRTRRGTEYEIAAHYLYSEVDASAVGAAAHIINWDPARVILSCRSKRLIIRECLLDLEGREGGLEGSIGTTSWYVLTGMALEYSERPGWRTEWETGD